MQKPMRNRDHLPTPFTASTPSTIGRTVSWLFFPSPVQSGVKRAVLSFFDDWRKPCGTKPNCTTRSAVCISPSLSLPLFSFSHPLPAAENLAPRAAVSANSQYNHRYAPKWAVDGIVPPEGSKSADLDHAWCVRKEKSGDRGWFCLEWKTPVTVAEVVYFGRTSWFLNECWKEYALFVDDGAKPIAEGAFEMRHGPQKITLPKPRRVRSLKLVFKNSFGGFNPGAAEIAVFDASPSTDELVRRFGPCCAAGEAHLPPYLRGLGIDRPDPEKLGALIGRLKELHGDEYADADEHAAAFAKIDDDDVEALAELQRDVLLHDVDKLIAVKRHEITASHVYTYHYEGQQNGGGIYLIDPHDPDAEPVELVASPDGQILDCDLSYDAKRVLFSMRRGSAPGYHIYVVNIDGTGLAQLTDGPWHDYNACWLPDGGIASLLSSREPQFAYCWHAPVGILHRMEADGSGVQKLSANYLNDFTPYVLEDGRIIYSRWEYVDRPAIPIQSLWTVAPDGTGLSGYFGNRVLSPGTFMDARSVPGTLSILCTMTGHNGPTRGAIGLITRAEGVNDQDAIVNLTPDTPLPNVDQGNGNTAGTKPYSCPVPLDSERFLVSARGPVLVRTIDGTCQSVALPAPKDGMQYFFTQPVRRRMRPPVVSGLHRHEEPAKDAVVFVQDVYNGLEPTVRRGEVHPPPRRAGDEQAAADRSEPQSVRIPVPGHFLRGDLCGEERPGRGPGRRRGECLLHGARRKAGLLHGVGRRRPGRPADAELHPLHAGRDSRLRRLPRTPHVRGQGAVTHPEFTRTAPPRAAGMGPRRIFVHPRRSADLG